MLKPIKDFAGYSITENGQVWSDKRNIWRKPKVDHSGYAEMCMYDANGKLLTRQVATLVLETFGSERPGPEYQVDHIDRNKLNNHIDNLRWVTPKENTANRKEYEGRVNKPIVVTKGGKYVGMFKTMKDAYEFAGISRHHFKYHLDTRTPDKNGYIYKYWGEEEGVSHGD